MQGGRLFPLWLAVVVGLVYANTFTAPFIFDDHNAITENPYIRQLWPPRYLVESPPQSTVAGRPLVSLTLAINYAVSGLNPWSYHVVNLALHLGCAWLLLGLARRLSGSDGVGLAIAAIWAVHPLLTESVTYVIQRTELLMAFCVMLTLHCLMRGRTLAAVGACAAGMACKEVAVVTPVLAFLFDRTFLAGSFREAWRQRGSFYLALAGTWLVLAAILLSGPRDETVGFGHASISPLDYLLTQGGVIMRYLQLAVWPHPLVLDYDDWPIGPQWRALVGIAALLVATVWALRQHPKVGFLGAWVFIILSPTSSFVPIVTEVAAERRMYLPSMAVVALVVMAVAALVERGRGRLTSALDTPPLRSTPAARAAIVAAVVLVLLFGGLSFRRNLDYQSATGIWQDTVEKRPRNVRALINLAVVMSAQGQTEQAQAVREEAGRNVIALYRRALAIAPENPEAHFNLGVALAGEERFEEALPHFQRAVAGSPRSSVAWYSFGVALARTERFASAETALRRALLLEPNSSSGRKQLGVVLVRQGCFADALAEFEMALVLRPEDPDLPRYIALARQQGESGAP